MKNTLFLLCFFLFKTSSLLISQCLPFSGSDLCKDAKVFCSPDELNGYQCTNPDNSPNPCTPFYPFIGPAHKAGWWAFVCDGGQVIIDVEIISCQGTGDGLKVGLFSGCECDLVIESKPSPKCINKGIFRISESLTACKTYYLYIEGCDGDICDFIIHTSGGSAPHLNPLGKINNDQDRLIKICSNACNENFTIRGQNGNCEPTYHWTLNNIPLIGENENIDIDFPINGDFQLCVTAFTGYSKSGSFCEKVGPECTTLEVRPLNDRNGPIRYLCQEQIPYKWHDQLVVANGNYRNTFTLNNCCSVDSIINFIISNTRIDQNIYFVGCNTLDTYTFPINNKIFNSCTTDLVIYSSNSSTPNGCDSSYNLTALFLDFGVTFREECLDKKVEIVPRLINKTKSCGGGESFEFFYNWFDKNDKSKKSLGGDEIIQVDKKGVYCLELSVNTKLGTLEKKCVFEFCETIDENVFLSHPIAKLKGLQLLCPFDTSCIQFVDAPQGSALFSWNVNGGTILTTNPFSSDQICIAWNNSSQIDGKVCASYETNCGKSDTTCLDVKFGLGIKDIAGLNQTVIGLKTNLSAKGIGNWQKLSGPGRVVFANPNDPNTLISVSKYGVYVLSWSSQQNGCPTQGIVTIKFNKF